MQTGVETTTKENITPSMIEVFLLVYLGSSQAI